MLVNGEGDALHLKGIFIQQVNSHPKGWFLTQQAEFCCGQYLGERPRQ